jgi:hypothetical protein
MKENQYIEFNGILFFAKTTLSILDSLAEDGIIGVENEVYVHERDTLLEKRTKDDYAENNQYIISNNDIFFRVSVDEELGISPKEDGCAVKFSALRQKRGKWRWAKNIRLV